MKQVAMQDLRIQFDERFFSLFGESEHVLVTMSESHDPCLEENCYYDLNPQPLIFDEREFRYVGVEKLMLTQSCLFDLMVSVHHQWMNEDATSLWCVLDLESRPSYQKRVEPQAQGRRKKGRPDDRSE